MTIEEKIDEIENRMKQESNTVGVWDNHLTFHNLCADQVTIDGMWIEFGVFRGRSLAQFADRTENPVYGFDSFEGLPEKWDNDNPQGMFNLNGNIPTGSIDDDNVSPFLPNAIVRTKPWKKNVSLVKGWFEDTLPKFVQETPGVCALIHIDSDIYSAAVTIFKHLKEKIVDGTVIVFDEINDYPDYKNHEIKAFAEFLLETGFDYIPLVYQNLGYSQGCFRIIKK
jgi:hypothetical protein